MDPRATQPTGDDEGRGLDPLPEDGLEDDSPDPVSVDDGSAAGPVGASALGGDEPGDDLGDDDGDETDADDDSDGDDLDLDEDDQERALGGAPQVSATPADLEALVHYVVSKLVADPDAIEIASEQRGGTIYLALRVPESDLGRVIGREGRTAKAIRTLVSIAGSKNQMHARLDIDG